MILLPSARGALINPVVAPAGSTWNPSDAGVDVILTNGNLTAHSTAATTATVRGTIGHGSSGKYYYEAVFDVAGGFNSGQHAPRIGIGDGSITYTNSILAGDPGAFAIVTADSFFGTDNVFINGVAVAFGGWPGTDYVNGDVALIACDFSANKIWFGKNGTWVLSGNPGAGTGATGTITGSTVYYPICRCENKQVTARFASASWGYSAPSGFGEW